MDMRAVLLLVVAVCFAACEVNLNSEGIVSRETKKFAVTGTPDVQLDTFNGAIDVHSWDRSEVEVEIEKRAMEQALVDDMKVTAEQHGNKVVIKVTRPGRSDSFEGVQIGVHFSPSARIRVALPRQSTLTATSGDGSIVVEDVDGKITLTTNDGSVRGSRLSGDISVRSGDGSIRMDRAAGKLDVETEDGSITLEARLSALRARTADGSIRLDVEPDSVMTEDWEVQTVDGSIVLSLPPSFNGLLDAETRDGVVRTNNPNVSSDKQSGEGRREERRQTLRATLGSGGKTVRVRSGDGSIRIE